MPDESAAIDLDRIARAVRQAAGTAAGGAPGCLPAGLDPEFFPSLSGRLLAVLDDPALAGGVLARAIDHTLLKPEAAPEQIEALCREALLHGFCAVCVNPSMVATARAALGRGPVRLASVVGFPLGAATADGKRHEAGLAIASGADELDMVVNIGLLKAGRYREVHADIAGVTAADPAVTVKVIIETCLLTDAEKVAACLLALDAGARFVKTSTGFSAAGATSADVSLMRRAVGRSIGVKASGGVRTRQQAVAMIRAGANRIGTSSGPGIVAG